MRELNQLRSLHRFLCNVAVALLLAAPIAATTQPIEVMPLAEVEPGQRGYGLSVFSGAEVERFEVEVIGVWSNLQPRKSYVLARLSGQGLEESGVIAGMSGSPVYIDGRLLGAVSFGWPFSNEAIAGVTPAASMRAMLTDVAPEAPTGASLDDDRTLAGLLDTESAEARLRASLTRLRPAKIGEAATAVEWASAGFGPEARAFLAEQMGSVVAAGSMGTAPAAAAGAAGGETRVLQPGSAVAAVLVGGDLKLAATGTVTDREGDSVLAFGHPFLGLGAVEVPMAAAEILTVVSSRWTSFKVANLGEIVGAVDFDYLTGIRGAVGKSAPTVPMTLRLNEDLEPVRLELAKVPTLTPTLAAVSMLGALSAAIDSTGTQSVDLELRVDLGNEGQVAIEQSFDGPGSALASAIHVFSVTGYLMRNSLAEVEIRSLEVDLVTHREPRSLSLTAAHPSRTVVLPGERLDLNVDLIGYRDRKQRRRLEVEVPSHLASGRYMLFVGDGQSVDALRLGIEQRSPMTFPQALTFLNSLHSRRELRVLGVAQGAGLAVAGEVLPDLPGSVRSLWAASGSGSAKPLKMAVVDSAAMRLDRPAAGLLRVDIEVKRGEPIKGGESGEAAGSKSKAGTRKASSRGGNG